MEEEREITEALIAKREEWKTGLDETRKDREWLHKELIKIYQEKVGESKEDFIGANLDLAEFYIRIGEEVKAKDIITEFVEEPNITYEGMKDKIKSRTRMLYGLRRKRRTEMGDEKAFEKLRRATSYYKDKFEKTKDPEDLRLGIECAEEAEDIYLFLTAKK